jgi:hypothetical protein
MELEKLAMLLTQIAAGVKSIERSFRGHRKLSIVSGIPKPRRSARAKVRREKTILEIANSFIRDRQEMLAVYLIDKSCWAVESVPGQCAGRLQRENLIDYSYAPGWSVVVPCALFTAYVLKIGVSKSHLTQLLNDPRIKSKRLCLVKKGRAVRCYVIPLEGEPNLSAVPAGDTQGSEN